MKLFTALHLATGIAAFTLTDLSHIFNQLPIAPEDGESSWPALDSIISDARKGLNLLEEDIEEIVDDFLPFSDDDFDDDPDLDVSDLLDRPRGPHKHNMTIYELISSAKFASNFTALISKHKDLVKLLNSTDTNSTLFVPINSAFARIPKDGKKPPPEFLEALLNYHVGDDTYFGKDLFPRHTIPTLLKEDMLGGEPQRLRVRVGFLGTRVNFYSKVVAANVATKNGVVHFVNHILIPPPFAGRLLTLFPDAFSTLLLAYEKTDFVDKVVHRAKTTGGTVFAPSNAAFRRLGPRANAFLFNTPRGLKCLEALLKYQVAPNVTLYSDAKYEAGGSVERPISRDHFELETLLGKKVFVDVKKWHGIITGMSVNRWVKVGVQDVVARNAVVHVVNRVPIPPHKHKKPKDGEEAGEIEEISPEELEERLTPYMDDEAEDGNVGMGEL